MHFPFNMKLLNLVSGHTAVWVITACQPLVPSAVLIGAIRALQRFTLGEALSLPEEDGALALEPVINYQTLGLGRRQSCADSACGKAPAPWLGSGLLSLCPALNRSCRAGGGRGRASRRWMM